MNSTNRQVRLAARPAAGLPRPSDWELTTEPIPTPAEGEFVVAVSHLSIDPAMRGWMNAGASYIEPVEVGAVMRAGGGRTGHRLRASRTSRSAITSTVRSGSRSTHAPTAAE